MDLVNKMEMEMNKYIFLLLLSLIIPTASNGYCHGCGGGGGWGAGLGGGLLGGALIGAALSSSGRRAPETVIIEKEPTQSKYVDSEIQELIESQKALAEELRYLREENIELREELRQLQR